MLIYHPVYDLSHGMFRMLRLLNAKIDHELKWDTYRILDLYYLFPHLLADARLPPAMTKRKREFGKLASKYSRVPSPRMFIQQMRGIHETVGRSLAAKGFIEPFEYDAGLLRRTEAPIPVELVEAFAQATEDENLVQMLANELAVIPLSGSNGLKDRTGLLEHRYDAA
jgi:hypothetical protein